MGGFAISEGLAVAVLNGSWLCLLNPREQPIKELDLLPPHSLL